MIDLLVDAAVAVVKLADRACTAVENVCFRETPPLPVETHPSPGADGCAASAGPGGHPIRATSDLLRAAGLELLYVYDNPTHPIIADLLSELRDRAAQFAAAGD